MIKKGIIKVNPYKFNPVINVLNGRYRWGGTKREEPDFDSYRIIKEQEIIAFEYLNKEVNFEFIVDKGGETLAKLILSRI